MYSLDKRVVLTLDAGGTNFVFSAIQGFQQIAEPVCLSSASTSVEECLNKIVAGFEKIKRQLDQEPVAISFAFPGPADYKNGIIGDLPNIKAFRGGVALGPYLRKYFNLPVYINNDGHLFAYGEALAGTLPMVNSWLTQAGNPKQYKNLLGITLGTGLGSGIVIDNTLLSGDNGSGGHIWCLRNPLYNSYIVEESVSIRAIVRVYEKLATSLHEYEMLTPKDIFEIAEGKKDGDKQAAIASFAELGSILGQILTSVLTVIDGLVVIGGGLIGAAKYILPAVINELRQDIGMMDGTTFPIMQSYVYNLADKQDREAFLNGNGKQIQIFNSNDYVYYDMANNIGLAVSSIGTNKAVMCGAYAFALQQLDK